MKLEHYCVCARGESPLKLYIIPGVIFDILLLKLEGWCNLKAADRGWTGLWWRQTLAGLIAADRLDWSFLADSSWTLKMADRAWTKPGRRQTLAGFWRWLTETGLDLSRRQTLTELWRCLTETGLNLEGRHCLGSDGVCQRLDWSQINVVWSILSILFWWAWQTATSLLCHWCSEPYYQSSQGTEASINLSRNK